MSASLQAESDIMLHVDENMALSKSRAKTATRRRDVSKKAQTHRRSRTGCYTCRLRRKKCDESEPSCSACRNLGLQCDYKRPLWWGNTEWRQRHKDSIKNIMKDKKLSEKSTVRSHMPTPGSDVVPHFNATRYAVDCSDQLDRRRSRSVDSSLSLEIELDTPYNVDEYDCQPRIRSCFSSDPLSFPDNGYLENFPYEVDIKTERQIFVDNVLQSRDVATSLSSSYHPRSTHLSMLSKLPETEEWNVEQQIFDDAFEQADPEPLTANFFEATRDHSSKTPIELSECDQEMLEHFVTAVAPMLYPVMAQTTSASACSALVRQNLTSNAPYLNCCLSMAAQHLRTVQTNTDIRNVDKDIMRYRYAAISALVEALAADKDHSLTLNTALAMISYQTKVGHVDETLPDISWHQHFEAAISLITRLDLPAYVSDSTENAALSAPFSMTIAAFIDILGATMLGRAPTFAHTYREKHLSATNASLGLRDLTGCDDRVLYLISEIACLESLKRDGMDDVQICNHVTSLGIQIGLTESNADGGPKMPFSGKGELLPEQLCRNITRCYRLAARIYLCSLVPGFSAEQSATIGLVEKLAHALEFVPSGEAGFDRSLVWVYLTGCSVSLADSTMRDLFEERVRDLGRGAEYGSFGRLNTLIREVWMHVDAELTPGSSLKPYVSWRDVMQMKDWEFLLI